MNLETERTTVHDPRRAGFWTPSRVDQLRELAAAKMSSRQIATILGANGRNAVISAAHRHKIPLLVRAKDGTAQKAVKAALPPVSKPQQRWGGQPPFVVEWVSAEDVSASPPAITIPSGGLPLLDIATNGCRYGVTPDDAETHLFCGEPQRDGSSYCGHHHGIARQPVRPAPRISDEERERRRRQAHSNVRSGAFV